VRQFSLISNKYTNLITATHSIGVINRITLLKLRYIHSKVKPKKLDL
jgi:hypothetical protein